MTPLQGQPPFERRSATLEVVGLWQFNLMVDEQSLQVFFGCLLAMED
jgi:hypothetical protein